MTRDDLRKLRTEQRALWRQPSDPSTRRRRVVVGLALAEAELRRLMSLMARGQESAR